MDTVQGGVPPYGVKETLVVNGKKMVRARPHYFTAIGSILVRIDLKPITVTCSQMQDDQFSGGKITNSTNIATPFSETRVHWRARTMSFVNSVSI